MSRSVTWSRCFRMAACGTALSLCLTSCAPPMPAQATPLTPAQAQLRETNKHFNETVGEGAVIGAVLGGVLGLALGGGGKGGAQMAALGAGAGALLVDLI